MPIFPDGQVQPVGTPFHTIWGNDLLYPGDPSAPAREVINCHCVLVPDVDTGNGTGSKGLTAPTAEEAQNQQRSETSTGIIDNPARIVYNSGASYGAYYDDNDPFGEKRNEHAERYYAARRNSSKKYFVDAVAKNSHIPRTIVEKAYKHVFEDKHELEKGYGYFDADYDMSESFRRLHTNSGIEKHDLILLRHEALEYDIMQVRSGIDYRTAHDLTVKYYDYHGALIAWKRGKK